MKLSNLPKITDKSEKRIGQGHGSGRGKTAGRGTKGQKARGDIPIYFEGGALPLIKRLPFTRGKNKNKSLRKKPMVVNVKVLNLLPKGTIVTIKTLAQHNIVKENDAQLHGVKILGDGELSVALTVILPISKGAQKKVEKAGGKVESGQTR